MIHHVDRAVEQFLRREGALAETTIDISFDAPDRSWGAARTRPTINCFLWEIVRNPGHLTTGIQRRVSSDGAIERRQAPPVVDLHYLVTAWATEYRDEHQLLGTVLSGILANRMLPADLLPGPLADARCGLSLAPYDKHVPGEFWSALDGRLRPGLQMEISLPLEVFAWQPTATPAEAIGVSTAAIAPPPRPEAVPSPGPLRRRRSGGALVMEGRPDDTDAHG
jgi:Pvc16 N-terminal domain